MAYMEDSLGAMLQGVSQQPSRLRVDGQVTLQENYESNISTGMTSRPGTDDISKLVGSVAGMEYQRIAISGTEYTIGYGSSLLKIWKLDGTALTMVHAGGLAYVGADMVFYTDNSDLGVDTLFCLNRDTTVLADATIPGRAFHAVLFSAVGGLFSRDYQISVKWDAEEIIGTYTTPDGTGGGDAAQTSSSFIIDALKTSIEGHIDVPGGMTFDIADDVMVINFTQAMTATVEDGDYGAILNVATDRVDSADELPRFAQHGHVVRITGAVSDDDDYFLKFISDTTETDLQGFGDDGVWKETFDPTEAPDMDADTLPHTLTITGTTATFIPGAWFGRRVGNQDGNPIPNFVGGKLRDIGGFESRLVFVTSAGRCNMTRTDEPLDFFKKSAVADSASDPIEIKSNKADGISLDWIVPFDRNLLLVSDPGAAQFVVSGGGITPTNASMVLTTEYAVESKVRPVSTGRTVMLPFVAGLFAGMNEFFTEAQSTSNAADTLTAAQDKYIGGTIKRLAVAENFNRVAMTSDTGLNTIWIYQYLWSNNERLQSSWYKLLLPNTVKSMWYSGNSMFIIMEDPGVTGAVVLMRMDLNRTDDAIGSHITLDRKATKTVDGSFQIVVDYASAQVVQGAGCDSPGDYAEVINENDEGDGTFTLTLDEDVCPNGSTVVSGLLVERMLVPTMPRVQDAKGNTVSSAKIAIGYFNIHLDASSDVKATRSSPYRADQVFFPRRFPLDDEPLDPNRSASMDYVLRIPWRELSSRSTLTIASENHHPDTILEIEWGGQVTGVKRRM